MMTARYVPVAIRNILLTVTRTVTVTVLERHWQTAAAFVLVVNRGILQRAIGIAMMTVLEPPSLMIAKHVPEGIQDTLPIVILMCAMSVPMEL